LSHLFNSIAIAPIDTCVVKFTWVFLNSTYALVKHKGFINYILLSPNSLQSLWPIPTKLSNPYHTIHIFFCHIYSINILNNLKCWTNPFHCCLSCLNCDLWYVYVVLFCVIVCAKSYVLSWEEWKYRDLQKGKWHTYLLPTFIMH
jgi:hypothetical protein